MRRLVLLVPAALVLAFVLGGAASADREGIARFATLPSGPGHPEGIAADPGGNIYAASFSFVPPNFIYKFDRGGRVVATVTLAASVPLGMQWGPDDRLYVADFGNGNVLQFTPPITSQSVPSRTYSICTAEAHATPSTCGLNAIAFDAITFDATRLLYVSDSFGGRVFTVQTSTGAVAVHATDERLRAPLLHGFPPFGANGLAFDADSNLYVANTADDRILKITAGSRTPVPYTESINGADGIYFDRLGHLWVCANQENTLYVLDVSDPAEGRVLDIRGSFEGVGRNGEPRGLLFPASVVLSGDAMYVTNTALDFRHHFVDENAVTRFTISRVPLGPSR